MPFVQYHEWEMQHFDIYHASWFEKSHFDPIRILTSTYWSQLNDYRLSYLFGQKSCPWREIAYQSELWSMPRSFYLRAPIELNEQNFSQFISHSDLPVFIDLWAEWCGPCKMMAPHFAEVAKQNPQVILLKLIPKNLRDWAVRLTYVAFRP